MIIIIRLSETKLLCKFPISLNFHEHLDFYFCFVNIIIPFTYCLPISSLIDFMRQFIFSLMYKFE